ncbi:hypothetical protein B0H63DRAFT_178389 [Podospora didyma]|uniref:Uncharacterized protein n=1 Tax=Podospora didyma TaxID=330526 RepID=A0AAE0NP07_9PEZI|nr:hypothetical protein B0H63DRAFT_178389 [Podospora didyma]
MAQPPFLGSNNPFRRKAQPPVQPPELASPSATSQPPDALARLSASSSAPALSSSDHFRHHLQALSQPGQPPPTTSFQKPKVVKKVRVQSPPPSSPESVGVPDLFFSADRDPGEEDNDDGESSRSGDDDGPQDSFGYISPSASNSEETSSLTPPHGPPPNPFQKTLQDLEDKPREPVESPSVLSTTRSGALDVGAFGRLLLTGQARGLGISSEAAASSPALMLGPAQIGVHPAPSTGDGASTTDTSSISRQSIFDAAPPLQDTPRTSHEISEYEIEDDQRGLIGPPRPTQAPTILRKKPPPPSSRHGKLIHAESGTKSQPPTTESIPRPLSSSSLSGQLGRAATVPPTLSSREPPPTFSNINKPLPPAPHVLFIDENAESIFDREAAGKVPESDVVDPNAIAKPPPRLSTPSSVSPSVAVLPPQGPKKPPPPPRRQAHGRSDSKPSGAFSTISTSTTIAQLDETDPSIRRSSLDSIRSRSSSIRVNVHAPAPPPPRRPTHAPRASSSISSPSAAALVSPMGSERSPVKTPEFSASSGPLATAPGESGDTGSSGVPTDHPAVIGSTAEPLSGLPLPGHSHTNKLSPPPPPPARNTSVRSKRPANLSSSFDRRGSVRPKEQASAAPAMAPPPPPRQRGSSRGSIDGGPPPPPPAARRTSVDNAINLRETLVEEPGPKEMTGGVTAVNDILADLTALQREVDALRAAAAAAAAAAADGG